MSFDAHKNFAYSTVATAPSPASSGTSLVVASGDGSKFPAVPFNATVWPASSQPTTANAEIVRVTNVSTDTFTITRTQESTSARTIVVGDQIAATITAKTLTDVETAPWGDIQFVAAPTGVAATDSAAIQEAHDVLPSTGGIVLLRHGTYVLDPASPLAFSKAIYLKGHGRKATTLTIDTATVTPIGVTATGAIFEDFTLQNVHATAPTAGAGIAVTANGNRTRYRDIEIDSFYICIDQQYGNGWVADRCFISDYKSVGIKVQNLAATDSGDGAITNCQISSSVAATTTGILFNSGGNLRIIGNQLYGGDAGNNNCGISVSPLDGVNTSDILIYSNSIEDFIYGVRGQLPGSATGVCQAIQIVGNEFFSTTAGDCINFDMGTASRISEIIVSGNRLRSGSRAVVLGNVDLVTLGSNLSSANTALTFTNPVTHAGGAMTKLFDTTLGADTASIDTGANGIPSGFSAIKIVILARSTLVASTENVNIRFNNDSGSNYLWEELKGVAATASAAAQAATTSINPAIPAASETANYASSMDLEIPGYDQTSFYKAGLYRMGRPVASASPLFSDRAFSYLSTAAITRVAVSSPGANLKAGSRMIVYGMP